MMIRPVAAADHEAIWQIFHEVVATGDAFAFDPAISRRDALAFWCGPGQHVFVAEQEGRICGSYFIKANQQGGGAHVANAGYMVVANERGKRVGRLLAEHSLLEAKRLGFRAMQFNFVISSNEPAVRLWQEFGFAIVGTLPAAFLHPRHGYVDVYVMFRDL